MLASINLVCNVFIERVIVGLHLQRCTQIPAHTSLWIVHRRTYPPVYIERTSLSIGIVAETFEPEMETNGVPRQSSTSPYYGQRPGSTASSIHSTGGLPGTISGSWANAVLEAGQNGILKFSRSVFKACANNSLKSNIDITATADSTNRTSTAYFNSNIKRPQTSNHARYPPRGTNKHHAR